MQEPYRPDPPTFPGSKREVTAPSVKLVPYLKTCIAIESLNLEKISEMSSSLWKNTELHLGPDKASVAL